MTTPRTGVHGSQSQTRRAGFSPNRLERMRPGGLHSRTGPGGRALQCAVALLVACSAPERPSSLPEDASTDIAPLPDVRRVDVPPIDPCGPPACGAEELCGPAPGSGNGLDDNCNGRVDENCPCTPGEMRACFAGPPDRRGVGACTDGTMRCTELGAWVGNECTGGTVAAAETCNHLDDNCNGAIDEGMMSCEGALNCPSSVGGLPLQDITVDGHAIDPTARGFQWTFTCPTGVTPCPTPTSATDSTFTIRVARAGIYRIQAAITRADGRVEQCSFPLYAQGRGLRVELDWDRKGGINAPGADMDLHVGIIDRRRNDAFGWFTNGDCYFYTCKAPGGVVNWRATDDDTRFAASATSEDCQGAPPPWGDAWRASGRCWNPRLDVDNIECDPSLTDTHNPSYCFTENATVDAPPEDASFRLMVNFYRDHGICTDADTGNDVVHPTLTVNCGGITRAALGSVDDGLVPMRCQDNPMIGSANWSWLAADVHFVTNACGLSDCRVTPLRATPMQFAPCSTATPKLDLCQDSLGRVFVRNSGGRGVDTVFSESP